MNYLNNPEIQKRIREAFNDPYLQKLHRENQEILARPNTYDQETEAELIEHSQWIDQHAAELGRILCHAVKSD